MQVGIGAPPGAFSSAGRGTVAGTRRGPMWTWLVRQSMTGLPLGEPEFSKDDVVAGEGEHVEGRSRERRCLNVSAAEVSTLDAAEGAELGAAG